MVSWGGDTKENSRSDKYGRIQIDIFGHPLHPANKQDASKDF